MNRRLKRRRARRFTQAQLNSGITLVTAVIAILFGLLIVDIKDWRGFFALALVMAGISVACMFAVSWRR